MRDGINFTLGILCGAISFPLFLHSWKLYYFVAAPIILIMFIGVNIWYDERELAKRRNWN